MSPLESAYAAMLGVRKLDAGQAELPFRPELLGRPGYLHGGAIAGLLGLACDDIVWARGVSFDVLDTVAEFRRGGREAMLHVRAEVLHLGASVVTVRAIAWQRAPGVPIASMMRKYRRRPAS